MNLLKLLRMKDLDLVVENVKVELTQVARRATGLMLPGFASFVQTAEREKVEDGGKGKQDSVILGGLGRFLLPSAAPLFLPATF